MPDNEMRQILTDFADQYLAPYQIKTSGADEKLIPELCPLCRGGSHNRDRHTFCLFLNNGTFVCKRGSCGRHGRFEELARELAGRDIKLPRSVPVHRSDRQHVLPSSEVFPPTPEIYSYFQTRRISRQTVDAMNISSDAMGNIVFRFFWNGEEIYRKYRMPRKPEPGVKVRKEWQDSGTNPILFNMDNCVFTQPLVITEGQIDAMSLHEAGITNVVSVPCGVDTLSWVETCWSWLEKFKTIILFGDSDAPGRRMVETLIKRLGEYRTLVVRDYPQIPGTDPPAYCKDANEILYRFGESMLLEMVEGAEEIKVRGLLRLADIVPYDPTSVPRIKTNIPTLDATIGGLAEGGVSVLTGESGNGKSTLAGLFMLNGIEQGYNCCAYSGELTAQNFQEWIHLQAAGSDWITLKYDRVRGQDVPVVPPDVARRIMDWYAPHMYLYNNDEVFVDVKQADAIIEVFTTAARRNDCRLFLVDNLLTTTADSDEEFRSQAVFVNNMKQFAKRYQAHVLIVAHARKLQRGASHIAKSDVSGSSAIVNLADCAIVSERPDLRIIKNRGQGTERTITCAYCGDSRRIYEVDKGDLNRFSWDKKGLVPPKVRADSMPEYGIQLSQLEKQPF